ncbi:hypothetical protein GCM10020331_008100 [Ectobacillus funiculus]
MDQIKEILLNKGFIIKPPIIPVPEKKLNLFIRTFFKWFLGHVRPMQALEIIHLYDNIENGVASKALIMAFAQVAKKMKKIRDLFERGRNLTHSNLERYMKKSYMMKICLLHLFRPFGYNINVFPLFRQK